MGLGPNPLGKELHYGGGDRHFPIIGVVMDFNYQSLNANVHPLAYFIDSGPTPRTLVRVRMDHPEETIAIVIATVGLQSIRAARRDPVEALRYE